ncbi:ribonuclease P [Candidatus Woesearchaeota archaeon]|nr:ribonuclease P [Candidatus Woesearchaeota archaeon]
MAQRRYSKKPGKEKLVAKERIEVLFSLAAEAFWKSRSLCNRYVSLARKIAMKYKVSIRPELKRRFCKHCYKYLMPGVNVRVRTTEGHVTYYCLECKKFMRFPYKKGRPVSRRIKRIKSQKL